MYLENFIFSMEKFVKIEICLLHSDYVYSMKKTVKVPCSSQIFMHIKIYMHHGKTSSKKCPVTNKTGKISMQARLRQPIEINQLFKIYLIKSYFWSVLHSILNALNFVSVRHYTRYIGTKKVLLRYFSLLIRF